jgi:hypothetical protein
VLALVLQVLTTPYLAADIDDFAGAGNRGVVGHAVEALDDLWARGAQAEREPAIGDVVEAGRGHRGQRGRSGVQLQDARGQLNPFCAGGQVPQRAHRVERIRLGDKDNVQPGAFEVGHFGGHLFEPAPVVDPQSDPHV